MHSWKWMLPGMRVKRWLALMLLGLFFLGIGLTVWLDTQGVLLVEDLLFSFLQHLGVGREGPGIGLLLMGLGLFLLLFGMRCLIRSLMAAVLHREEFSLADLVYKNRGLSRGPKIVVIGGGTGLSTLLRGLKEYACSITAIVTVADDGGSSGTLRQELGMLPPGDIRNTMIALADTEPLMERLFQYRFSSGQGLSGHSFGNLFLAAMTEITGDFEEAIQEFSKVLAIRGRVIPATLSSVQLRALFQDGTECLGESKIPTVGKAIARISLEPKDVSAPPAAIKALNEADLVVLGPGSLYTSVIPNLLVPEIKEALINTKALKVYVCNVMTQPGETDHMHSCAHVRALGQHVGDAPIFQYVLVNNAPLSPMQREKYAKEQAYPVRAEISELERLGFTVIAQDLLCEKDLVRHESEKLARVLMTMVGKNLGRMVVRDGS